MDKTDVKSLYYNELEREIKEIGLPSFRTKQIFNWLHEKQVSDFTEMTNISKALIKDLEEKFYISDLELVQTLESEIDGTKKFLFKLWDDKVIETVLMKYNHGNSLCISSQVGCKMGCKFCASTIGGLERNLSASEMLDQVYKVEKVTGEKISNIVIMGMGEPLDNYDNLIRFLKLSTDERGLNISGRNIIVSTCGLVEQIRKLANEGLQVTLALSLHAATDEVRQRLMPIAKRYKINEVIEATKFYFNKTGRRLTYEYSMVNGVNDSKKDAKRLAELLKGINCHVNLIPVNPIKEESFEKSDNKIIINFKNILEKNRINVTIRREMGADIEAACGQLRNSYIDN